MRTDAKIGFAIGGVLLAVLTVYAIVVPKHTAKKPGTVALVNTTPTGSDTPAPPSLAGTDTGTTAQPPVTPSHDAGATGTATHPLPGTPGTSDPIPGGGTGIGNGNTSGTGTGVATGGPSDPGIIRPDDKSTDGPSKPTTGTRLRVKPTPGDVAETSTSDRTYTIKSGQTLSSIAYEVYGNSRFFVAIQRENRGLDPMHLKPGTTIKLPDITPPTVEPVSDRIIPPSGMVEDHVLPLVETTPSHTPRTSVLAGAMTGSNDGRTYTVKSGDNLYAIARKVLGSGRKADALYELNKDLIGPDKSRLKLGMVLKLPEATRTAIAE
jgi:nucleoid-associated protein YgaU